MSLMLLWYHLTSHQYQPRVRWYLAAAHQFISVYCSGDGVDFAFAQTTATFSPGSTNTTINITVSKDNILEEREIFNLNFIIPLQLRGQVIPGNITTATGIIIDDTSENELLTIFPLTYIIVFRYYCGIWSSNVHCWWKWWSGTNFTNPQ